jgi:hypothetical protein
MEQTREEIEARKAVGFFGAVLRWHLRYTVSDVERPLELSPGTVSQFERGDFSVPQDIVGKILDYLAEARGKHYREPGSRKEKFDTEDRWFGINDPRFRKWWHRSGKGKGGADIQSKEEADQLYSDWVASGSPLHLPPPPPAGS